MHFAHAQADWSSHISEGMFPSVIGRTFTLHNEAAKSVQKQQIVHTCTAGLINTLLIPSHGSSIE